MPTPRPLVALLRAPGGDPWTTDDARVVEILTSTVRELGASPEAVSRVLEHGGVLACTSPRAAQWLAALAPVAGRGRVVCSGRRTARILEVGGWIPVLPAEGEPSGGAPAARRILSLVAGQERPFPVLYVRGRETAGSFERVLAAAEVPHEFLVVYDMQDRQDLRREESELLSSCDALAVMAPSCLRFLERLGPGLLARLREFVPALAGPTTAQALRQAGWRDVREACEPSCAALISLLASHESS